MSSPISDFIIPNVSNEIRELLARYILQRAHFLLETPQMASFFLEVSFPVFSLKHVPALKQVLRRIVLINFQVSTNGTFK